MARNRQTTLYLTNYSIILNFETFHKKVECSFTSLEHFTDIGMHTQYSNVVFWAIPYNHIHFIAGGISKLVEQLVSTPSTLFFDCKDKWNKHKTRDSVILINQAVRFEHFENGNNQINQPKYIKLYS